MFGRDDDAGPADEHQEAAASQDLRIFPGREGQTADAHPGEEDGGDKAIAKQTEHDRRDAEHAESHGEVGGAPDDVDGREGEDEEEAGGMGGGALGGGGARGCGERGGTNRGIESRCGRRVHITRITDTNLPPR